MLRSLDRSKVHYNQVIQQLQDVTDEMKLAMQGKDSYKETSMTGCPA